MFNVRTSKSKSQHSTIYWKKVQFTAKINYRVVYLLVAVILILWARVDVILPQAAIDVDRSAICGASP